jgi:hypothetical protein
VHVHVLLPWPSGNSFIAAYSSILVRVYSVCVKGKETDR